MIYLILALQLITLAVIVVIAIARDFKITKNIDQKLLFIDTSVLIDGRIVGIAGSGFIGYKLAITRSVVNELQLLADGSDSEKRSRARYGLDVITDLQAIDGVDVLLFQDEAYTPEGVDRRLLTLANENNAVLCTVDYNLNKVAGVEGVVVANVNELAKNLRVAHLPGDKIKINLTSKGNDGSQAVGHLEDGTMVVVEGAKSKIGSIVDIEVVRSLQTDAGRMLFARMANGEDVSKNNHVTRIKSSKTKQQKQTAKQKSLAKTDNHRPRSTSHKTKKSATGEDRLLSLVDQQQQSKR